MIYKVWIQIEEIDENKDFADFFQKFFDEAFKQIAVNENHQLKSAQKLKEILDAGTEKKEKDDLNFDDLEFDL